MVNPDRSCRNKDVNKEGDTVESMEKTLKKEAQVDVSRWYSRT